VHHRAKASRPLRILRALVLAAAVLPAVLWTAAAAGSYGDEVLADGPLGYWRLGETSGTTAADQTAANNPGTYTGGVTLAITGALTSDPDTAARFDGSNDLVRIPDPANGHLDVGSSDFTVELWLNTTLNGERLLIGKRSSGPYWQLTVTDDPGQAGRVRTLISTGSVTRTTYNTTRVDDGQWHHLVVLFDRDLAISYYLDGNPDGTTTTTTPGNLANSANLQLGKVSGYPYYNGDLDEIALYPTLLTPTRIQAHHAAR
jgi:hypothetical protein